MLLHSTDQLRQCLSELALINRTVDFKTPAACFTLLAVRKSGKESSTQCISTSGLYKALSLGIDLKINVTVVPVLTEMWRISYD